MHSFATRSFSFLEETATVLMYYAGTKKEKLYFMGYNIYGLLYLHDWNEIMGAKIYKKYKDTPRPPHQPKQGHKVTVSVPSLLSQQATISIVEQMHIIGAGQSLRGFEKSIFLQ